MCKSCWWDRDPRNIKNGGTVDLEKLKMDNQKAANPEKYPSHRSMADSSVQSHCITEISFVNNTRALNNRFILEAYTGDRSLKAKESSGFAMLSQKVTLIGLKLLADTKLSDGTWIPKGFTAYVKEEFLFSHPAGKSNFEASSINGKFIIVDSSNVEFVVP
jgi:hypothetical protein